MRNPPRSLWLLAALPVLAVVAPAAQAATPRALGFGGTPAGSSPPLLAGAHAAAADATALGALGVGILPDQRLLAGADGTVTVSLPSRVAAPTTVGDVELTITLPAGYAARAVRGDGWHCADQTREVRCRSPGSASAGSLSDVEVDLDARPGEARSARRVSARATWRQSGSRYATSDGVTLTPERGLSVRAESSDPDTLSAIPGTGDAFPMILSGHLGRFVDGIPTNYEFRQVCGPDPSDCHGREPPRVRFTTPTEGAVTSSLVTAGFVAPTVRHKTTLWFELVATDWRGSARDVVAVHVSPQSNVKLEPRVGKVTGVNAEPLDPGAETTQGLSRSIVVSGSALAGPRPGESTRLVADGSPGRLVRPRWSVVHRGREIPVLKGVDRTRHVLTFRVPRRPPPSLTIRIRGLVNGHRVETTVVVRFRRPLRHLGPATAQRAADEDEEDKGPFCTIWTAADGKDTTAGTRAKPIELKDGTKVMLEGVKRAGDGCDKDDAAVGFDAAQVEVANSKLSFTDVHGTLTAKGLTFTEGWLRAPQWSFLTHALRAYHVVAPAGTSILASLKDDEWGPLTGEMKIPEAVEWIKLPTGWTYSEGKTVLSFKAGESVGLRTEAKAPKGQAGTVAFSGSFLKDGGLELTVDAQKLVTIDSGRRMGSEPNKDLAVYLSGKGSVKITKKKKEGEGEGEGEGETPANPTADPTAPDPTATAAAGDPDPEPDPDKDAEKKWKYEGSVSLNTDPADRELELSNHFHVKGLSGTWDKKGVKLKGTGVVLVKNQRLEVEVAGQYKNKSEWKLAATQRTPWKLTNDVSIDGVCGLVERRPYDPKLDDPKKADEPKDEDKDKDKDKDAAKEDPKESAADTATEDKDAKTACEALDSGKSEDTSAEEEESQAAVPGEQVEEPEEQPDVYRVAFAGGVKGWSPSAQVKNINADALLTNRCAAKEKACNNGDVRLRIGVKGEAKIPHVAPFKFDAAAQVNLTTKQVTFKGGRELTGFGPPQFRLSKANLELSTGGTGWCKPKKKEQPETPPETSQGPAGGPEPTEGEEPAPAPTPAADAPQEEEEKAPEITGDQKLTFTAEAEGLVFDQRFTTKAEFTPKGYCLAALFNNFDPKLGAKTDRKAFENVGLYYSSAPVDLKFADRTLKLKGEEAQFSGDFNVGTSVPKDVQGPLAGKGTFTATLTKTDSGLAFKGKVAYKLAKTYWLIGGENTNATRFGIDDASLDVEYKPGDFAMTLSAGGTLATPASADGSVPASTTPLRASIGIKLGTETQLSVTANVDTDRAPGGKVENAFGQQGLTVERLIVSASLGTTTSFGISAKGTLPQKWVSSLGAERDVPVAVTLKIASPATKSCLDVELGDAKSKKAVAKLGALTATYARVLVAPAGCTVGTGLADSSSYEIKPGFALAFSGSVGATPVSFSATLTRNLEKNTFAVKGELNIGKFDMGAASFDETKLNLDIDPENQKYNIAISGGLKIGESKATLKAELKATKTAVTANFDGQATVRFAGVTFAEGTAFADVAMSQKDDVWKVDKLAVRANTKILGISTGLQFAYANGVIDSAAAAFNVNAEIGPSRLGGGALFAYHAKGAKLTGNDCAFNADTRIEPDSGGKQLYLRLCGKIKFGYFDKDLRLTLALPHTIPIAFDTGKVNVPLGPASIHIEAALDAGLEIRVGVPTFNVRNGRAVAGGCLNLVLWKGCANAIDLKFERESGYFVGTFLGFAVRWGDPAWKATAPQDASQTEPNFLPGFTGAQRRIPFWRGRVPVRWKPLNGGEQTQSGVPASDNQSGVFADPVTRELITFWCVESTGAGSCKRAFLMRATQFRSPTAFNQEGLRRDATLEADEVELVESGSGTPRTKTVVANGQPVVTVSDISGVTRMVLTAAGRAAVGASELPESSTIVYAARGIAPRPLPGGDSTNLTSPSAVIDPGTGRNVFFVAKDGTIHDFTRESGTWIDYPLGGSVAPGTSPSAVYDANNGGRNVFYVGQDDAVYLMALSNGAWVHTRLGGNVAPGTSPSVVVDPTTGRNVFFVDEDLALHDLYFNNGKWIDYKIGGQVSPGSSPSAVVDPGSGRNVFYVGKDGALHDYFVEGAWKDYKMGGAPAAGSTPSVVVDPDTGRNVFFVDKGGAVHDFYISGGWQDYKMGGSVAPGTNLSAMVEPGSGGSGRNIFYAGSDGKLHDWYINGNAWADALLGGPVAPGTSPSAIGDPATGRNTFYVGTNRALRQLVIVSGAWQDNVLGGSVGG